MSIRFEGSLIHIDTGGLERMKQTLGNIDPHELDEMLRDTVNETAVSIDRKLKAEISAGLGILPHQIDSRMKAQKSDRNQHTTRSAFMWLGKHRMSGTRLIKGGHAPMFSPGQVQVGRFLWRRGFIQRHGTPIDGILMQREGDDRKPIHAAMAVTADIVQTAIDKITPQIPTLLEAKLDRRISEYLRKL